MDHPTKDGVPAPRKAAREGGSTQTAAVAPAGAMDAPRTVEEREDAFFAALERGEIDGDVVAIPAGTAEERRRIGLGVGPIGQEPASTPDGAGRVARQGRSAGADRRTD